MKLLSSSNRIVNVITTAVTTAGLVIAPIAIQPPEVHAAFPGYNGKIVFHSNRDGDYEIYAMNPDGSSVVQLTDNSVDDYDPTVSPEGQRIVFRSHRDGNAEIYTMDIDGSNVIRLTNDPGGDVHPTWSPDGSQIVYSSQVEGNRKIFIMNANGSVKTRVTNTADDDTFPSYSPDGTRLAFRRISGSTQQIGLVDIDGNNESLLNTGRPIGYANSVPVRPWSPDGSKILFSGQTGPGTYDIFTIYPDGSNLHQISNSPNSFIAGGASWSPDGQKILYNSTETGNSEVYSMDASGGDVTQLTFVSTDSAWAHFQPIPNNPPSTILDTLSLQTNTPASINVLSNDTDEEALDPANLTISTHPTHGTATIETEKIKYTPASNYIGSDQLTYQICDSFMLDQKCATGVLGITVTAGPAPAMPILSKVGTVSTDGSQTIYYTGHRPTFSGTAAPGSTIRVEIHSDPITLTTTTDANGQWSVTPDQDIPNGEHTVTITSTLEGATSQPLSFVLGINVDLADTGAPIWPLAAAGVTSLLAARVYLKRRQTL